jgi:hypothetical protein
MPRGDRTGPDGMGSMSGRGLGYCAGFGAPGFAQPALGRGCGAGRGRGGGAGFGAGWRRGWAAQPRPAAGFSAAPWYEGAPADETEALKARARQLHDSLERVNARLEEIDQNKG